MHDFFPLTHADLAVWLSLSVVIFMDLGAAALSCSIAIFGKIEEDDTLLEY